MSPDLLISYMDGATTFSNRALYASVHYPKGNPDKGGI